MSRSEDFGKVPQLPRQSSAAVSGAGALNPTVLSVEQAARVLAAVGARCATVENIGRDIEAGAPVNADGTVNLVHYAAWLAKEAATRGD